MRHLSRSPADAQSFRAALITAAVLALGVAASGTVCAQTTYYYTGGSNNWDTTTMDWSTSNTGSPTTAFVSSATSIARIGDLGTAGTLTLTTAITAQELDIDNTTAYSIAGTPALTLASGNINSNFLTGNAASSLSTTISVPLAGTDITVSATGTSGKSNGTGNDTVIFTAANTFSGNLNLGTTAAPNSGTTPSVNRVNIDSTAALPSTASIRFLNTETSFAVDNISGSSNVALVGSTNNNFVLNPNSATYTAGAFVSFIGATSGNSLTINGKISGNGDVTFSAGSNGGAGGVTLNAANTYAGVTTLANAASGIVRLGVSNALPTGTALVFGDGSSNNAGVVDLDGNNQTLASLATNIGGSKVATGITNTVSGTTSLLTISGGATTTYASVIGVPTASTIANASNNIALTLAVVNTGTLTLTGANTYTGATTISGGTLKAGAVNALKGTSGITVNTGGTLLLGGTGDRIGDAVPLLLSGGILNTAGLSERIGALTLNTSSSIDLGSGSTGSTLTLGGSSQYMAGSLAITDYNTGDHVFFYDSSTSTNGYQLSRTFLNNITIDGSSVTELSTGEIVAVPEPATVLGGALLVGAVGWNQRRRFRKMLVGI